MSSTNKTTHYNLSQYTASDKPTYLVDYNSDMSAIDTGIYNAQTEATTNTTSIGTLSNLDTTEKTNLVGAINEVNTQVGTNTGNIGTLQTSVAANTGNIGTMANLNTTDKTSLVNAVNEVDSNIKLLNFVNFDTYDNTITTTAGTLTEASVSVASNVNGSIAKIYGRISVANNGAINGTVTIPNTKLRPSSTIIINGNLLKAAYTSSGINGLTTESITIDTNGNITFPVTSSQYATSTQYILFNSVLFLQDFGDTPQPSN